VFSFQLTTTMSIPTLPRFHVLTLLHNPACSKSRAALALLRERSSIARPPFDLDVVNYLETPLTTTQLRSLTNYLVSAGVSPGQLVRDEPQSKDALGTAPVAEQVVAALSEHPDWLQRPIAIDWVRGRAVIGRPPEAVLSITEGVGNDE
jgi:arsenate reductase